MNIFFRFVFYHASGWLPGAASAVQLPTCTGATGMDGTNSSSPYQATPRTVYEQHTCTKKLHSVHRRSVQQQQQEQVWWGDKSQLQPHTALRYPNACMALLMRLCESLWLSSAMARFKASNPKPQSSSTNDFRAAVG